MSENFFWENAKISQKSLINPKLLFLGFGVGNGRNDCLFKIKKSIFQSKIQKLCFNTLS